MGGSLFGTDGIRARANRGPLTPEQVVRVGRALWVAVEQPHAPVLLACDTRISRHMICGALTAGITSVGLDVVDLGILPTPALALLVPRLGGALGVMVSASHNPVGDNGIKVLSPNGEKLAEEIERKIEHRVEVEHPDLPEPVDGDVGVSDRRSDAAEMYVELVVRGFRDRGLDLSGLRILLDCAHGATVKCTPRILRELGAELVCMGDEPDGTNINAGCGAVVPEAMQEAVIAGRVAFGMALDGDGDRVILADESGRLVGGDQVLAILALARDRAGELPGRKVVGTVMSNLGLEVALAGVGIDLVRTPVGDRHVAAAMRQEGLVLGGESSGHVIVPFEGRLIGDGTITGLEVACMVARQGSLAELASCMTLYPQKIVNVVVRRKPPLDELTGLAERRRDGERQLGSEGRIVIRYSGTEPLVRVMVEGQLSEVVGRVAADLAAYLEGELGS